MAWRCVGKVTADESKERKSEKCEETGQRGSLYTATFFDRFCIASSPNWVILSPTTCPNRWDCLQQRTTPAYFFSWRVSPQLYYFSFRTYLPSSKIPFRPSAMQLFVSLIVWLCHSCLLVSDFALWTRTHQREGDHPSSSCSVEPNETNKSLKQLRQEVEALKQKVSCSDVTSLVINRQVTLLTPFHTEALELRERFEQFGAKVSIAVVSTLMLCLQFEEIKKVLTCSICLDKYVDLLHPNISFSTARSASSHSHADT